MRVSRYAALGVANLASNPANQDRVLAEGALLPLVSLGGGDNGDLATRRFALAALASVAAARTTHPMLNEGSATPVSSQCLKRASSAATAPL